MMQVKCVPLSTLDKVKYHEWMLVISREINVSRREKAHFLVKI